MVRNWFEGVLERNVFFNEKVFKDWFVWRWFNLLVFLEYFWFLIFGIYILIFVGYYIDKLKFFVLEILFSSGY